MVQLLRIGDSYWNLAKLSRISIDPGGGMTAVFDDGQRQALTPEAIAVMRESLAKAEPSNPGPPLEMGSELPQGY